MQVRDVMRSPVVTCSVGSDLNHAAELMWDHDCGVVPVVDDQGRLAGIVTDRDVCMAAYTQGGTLRSIPVRSAMASHVLVCHLNDSLTLAEELMREGQVRRVPVIDDEGRPIGIISMSDLARLADRARKNAVDREIVQTLSAVSMPRQQTETAKAEEPARRIPVV